MDLAVKDVRRHAGRFATTAIGIGLLVAIVLTMNGIYRGNIADGLWLVDHMSVDLWVVERGRGGPFNEPSRVSEQLDRSVAAVPGVAIASPFIFYAVQRDVAGVSRQFTIIGYDVLGGLGGPPDLVEGRPITNAHFEIVADRSLGLRRHERVELGRDVYTVVGLTEHAVDLAGNPLVWAALPDAQAILYQQDNEAIRLARATAKQSIERLGASATEVEHVVASSGTETRTIAAVLVRLAPGANIAAVRSGIEQRIMLSTYTTAEERSLLLQGRLAKMSAILSLFRTLLLIVSVVIMALIVYVMTLDKIRALATLMLIGAPNRMIVRLILEQSLALAVFAFLTAGALVLATRAHFPRTLVFYPSDTAITFGVLLLGGVLASLFAIRRALRTPPSLALGS